MLTVGAIFSSCSTETWRLGSVIIRSGFAAATASRSISAVPIKPNRAVIKISAGQLSAGA